MAMSVSDESIDNIDDEMDPAEYEYPPGLIPDAEAEFDYILADGMVTIYEVGNLADTRIKSDCYVPVRI